MAPVVAILCYVAKLKITVRDAYCISGDSVFLYGEGVPGELSDLVNPVLSWVTSPTVFTYNPPPVQHTSGKDYVSFQSYGVAVKVSSEDMT